MLKNREIIFYQNAEILLERIANALEKIVEGDKND